MFVLPEDLTLPTIVKSSLLVRHRLFSEQSTSTSNVKLEQVSQDGEYPYYFASTPNKKKRSDRTPTQPSTWTLVSFDE
jgi:hypothetical protein